MYPTASNLVLMAAKAANQEAGIGYSQSMRIWDKRGIRIDRGYQNNW